MSSPGTPIDEVQDDDASPEDERLFALLDRYVEALQRDSQTGSRAAAVFLERHPELGPFLKCLDSLDGLVPRPVPPALGRVDQSSASKDTMLSDSSASGDDSPASSGSSSLFRVLPADFGGYELLEEIGRGGMGVVYKARHKSLGATVAIKMIRASQWPSEDEVRRFYREARAAAGLSHSHIVKVHDVGERDGLHFLAMDLVEGPNLSALTREGPFDPDRAAEIVSAVARAVHYLHSRGIIHRDLKPSNILLDDEGNPFVTDFGLAKVFTSDVEQTSTGAIVGTPCYMSPEQAWGRTAEVTTRSDVYSLGAILYELLTGRPPFREENPLEVLLRVRESEPMPPSHWNRRVPGDLEQICLRCLEKDPARRYESAEALAGDLQRFLKHEPLALPPLGAAHRLRRWARREPGLVARLMGLGVGACVEQAHYTFGDVLPQNHWPVMLVLALWALVSWACQMLLNRGLRTDAVPFVWAAADALFYTRLIVLAAVPRELLIIGYPLLIVASGFWIRVRLVTFMTAVCLASYLFVYLAASDVPWPPHYPVLLAGILLLTGTFVGYQVHRLRVLSRYFERKR